MQQHKENIVLSAWEMVTEFPSLKKLNFIPSFMGMLWLLVILLYQATFAYIYIFNKKDVMIGAFNRFLHATYFTETIIGLVIIFVLFMFLEPVATGGMIEMMHSYKTHAKEKRRRSWQGFFDGMGHFLPIFELHNLTAIFRPLPIITSYILLLRLFGQTFFWPITIIMAVYLFFAFFINICFSYANFFVIFENKTALQSLAASTGMAVRNIAITGRLYFTSLLLYLRTVIIGVIFLGIPFLISSTLAFVGVPYLKIIFLIVFAIISIVLFVFIVHLNSTLEIFILATWYEAYTLCQQEDTVHSSSGHGHSDAHDKQHDDHGHH